jgi:hypothetical protein
MAVFVNSATAGTPQTLTFVTKGNTAAVMTNSLIIANVTVGDIYITDIVSECITANDATASTLQYAFTPSGGSLVTISGASPSIASAPIGATVDLNPTTLGAAPSYSSNGIAVIGNGNGIRVSPGALSLVIGVGSTTGTWQHYLQYTLLEPSAVVTMAF